MVPFIVCSMGGVGLCLMMTVLADRVASGLFRAAEFEDSLSANVD